MSKIPAIELSDDFVILPGMALEITGRFESADQRSAIQEAEKRDKRLVMVYSDRVGVRGLGVFVLLEARYWAEPNDYNWAVALQIGRVGTKKQSGKCIEVEFFPEGEPQPSEKQFDRKLEMIRPCLFASYNSVLGKSGLQEITYDEFLSRFAFNGKLLMEKGMNCAHPYHEILGWIMSNLDLENDQDFACELAKLSGPEARLNRVVAKLDETG